MELEFAFAAFVAGILTILAPCVLPVLPIVVGGSVSKPDKKKPIVITISLIVSIILFTLLVRASTDAIGVSTRTLQIFAGYILLSFGVFTIFPEIWDFISLKLGLSSSSNRVMAKFAQRGDRLGDIMIGASLGPVFASCSPTYAVILSLVIAGNWTSGVIYLVLYGIGLGIMMLLVAFAGQKLVKKLGWATDPHGWLKRTIGAIFLIVGLAIITGWDKQIETWLIERGLYDPFAEFENNLRE